MNKKIILGIGALGAAILPATAVVACAPEKTEKPEKKEVVAAPAGAIAGYNAKAVAAKGAADGNTYTQAQIDKRDNKVAPPNAVVGKNSAIITFDGDGSGKTYTQDEIDVRDNLSIKAAPKNAVVGKNSKASNYSDDQVKDFLGSIIKEIDDVTIDLSSSSASDLGGNYSASQKATKAEIEKAISALATKKLDKKNVSAIIELISNSNIGTDVQKPDGNNYSWDDAYDFIYHLAKQIAIHTVDISNLGSNTFLSKKVTSNTTKQNFQDPSKAEWDEIIDVLANIKAKNQANTPLQKANVKAFIMDLIKVPVGNDITDPKSAEGTADDKTYTIAQIIKRDGTGAPKGAVLGENKKSIPAVGDGTGTKYTQAQIDARDLPSANAAPTNAVVGKNSIAKAAVGDGSGSTYTQAQIDKRDSK